MDLKTALEHTTVYVRSALPPLSQIDSNWFNYKNNLITHRDSLVLKFLLLLLNRFRLLQSIELKDFVMPYQIQQYYSLFFYWSKFKLDFIYISMINVKDIMSKSQPQTQLNWYIFENIRTSKNVRKKIYFGNCIY